MITSTTPVSPLDPAASPIDPAVVDRLRGFAEELHILDGGIQFMTSYLPAGPERNFLRDLSEYLEEFGDSLVEVLPETVHEGSPRLVPFALRAVADILGQAPGALLAFAQAHPRETRLAMEWIAHSLEQTSKTAGYIAETVMEEFPPLTPAAPAESETDAAE